MRGAATLPSLSLPDEAATTRAGAALGAAARAGDSFLLAGDLGTGKSTLARGFIAARLAAEGRIEDIPSPSYTLVNVYDTDAGRIWHADLYRLGREAEDIAELGLADAFGADIVLVEWPDRLGRSLPARHLALRLGFAANDGRTLEAAAAGAGWDRALGALGLGA